MSYQESSELSEPCAGSLDDPATLVSAQLAPVFVMPLLIVLPIRSNQFYASLLQALAQRVRVVGAVCDHPFRLLPRSAFGSGDADLFECGFRKRSFSRRGTFKPNSQRKTLTVDQYHPLRSLAALGFTDCRAPFLAGAKLPSRKASSHRSNPSPSKAPSNVLQASSQTSCSSTASTAASTWLERDTCREETATPQLESTLAHPSSGPNSAPPQKVPDLRPNLFMKQPLRRSRASRPLSPTAV
jgi:hypothetical protein